MSSKAWYYTLPGAVYAFGPVRFDKPISERDFRAYLREYHKVKRLPRGTEVWSTNE